MNTKMVSIHAEEYFEGWVADALANAKHTGQHVVQTDHGSPVVRDWRYLVPGDAAVNNIESVALFIVEMCEHYQRTDKGIEARMALHEDITAEVHELSRYLIKLGTTHSTVGGKW